MITIILLLIIGFMLSVFMSGIRIIRPTERGLVETLGSYSYFANPGFNWVIPIFQRMILVNITEDMIESGEKQMITNDNLNITVDAVIFFKIKATEEGVKAAMYNTSDCHAQIIALAKTSLRNIIGTMTLKSANSERSRINQQLLEMLIKETANWGIDIVRAELKEIDPPKDVQETMNKIVKAENERIAALDFATAKETQADGDKRAAIKSAEGRKQAQILEAEADAQAARTIAAGRADAIKIENEAATKYFTGNAVLLRKIEAVERSFGKNTKIFMPQNMPMVNVLDGLIRGDNNNASSETVS